MDEKKIEEAIRLLIDGLGDIPERPGLADTPARVARMYGEICCNIGKSDSGIIKKLPAERHDEIVLVRDIPFYSICEHHMLPFLGVCHVAYIPKEAISGISKLARTVEFHSRKLQVQERLTSEIADTLMRDLDPKGVIVVMDAEHLCMTMRGVKKPGARTVTSVVRGIFRDKIATRNEAMSLIGQKRE
ncbi:MAG: GTP cyclohydrolase I FolE [Planctomycetota bacterium]|jgi:GTP cyclohydrolase I